MFSTRQKPAILPNNSKKAVADIIFYFTADCPQPLLEPVETTEEKKIQNISTTPTANMRLNVQGTRTEPRLHKLTRFVISRRGDQCQCQCHEYQCQAGRPSCAPGGESSALSRHGTLNPHTRTLNPHTRTLTCNATGSRGNPKMGSPMIRGSPCGST